MKVNELNIALLISRCRSSYISPMQFFDRKKTAPRVRLFRGVGVRPCSSNRLSGVQNSGLTTNFISGKTTRRRDESAYGHPAPNDVEISRHAARIMQSYGSMMPGGL